MAESARPVISMIGKRAIAVEEGQPQSKVLFRARACPAKKLFRDRIWERPTAAGLVAT